MGEGQKVDVEQIMDQIRENIRRRRTAGENPVLDTPPSPFDNGDSAADVARLQTQTQSGDDVLDGYAKLREQPVEGASADFDRFNAGIERVNSLPFGFEGYAVIGRKESARAR